MDGKLASDQKKQATLKFTDSQMDQVEAAVAAVLLERFEIPEIDGIALTEFDAQLIGVAVCRRLFESVAQP